MIVNNSFSPLKTIRSRYALATVSGFTTININGNNTLSGVTLLSGNTLGPGYIYAPYIIAEGIDIIDLKRQLLRKERKEKLKKLNWDESC